MKKFLNNIYTLAVMLTASASFVACSNDIDEPQQPANGKYTMTIKASKGGDESTTRALSLEDNTLNASWAVGEEVTVYNVTKSAELTGTLVAQSSGESTTLSGSLTGTIEKDDVLRLKFLSPSYTSQAGTLEYIAANCDYAKAEVTVSAVSGSSITTNDAEFTNQQAIVKFTLKKKTDSSALSASVLTVSDGTNTVTVTPASATSEFFVAMPGFSGQTITLTATAGGDTYDFAKSSVSFTNGSYYSISVNLSECIALTSVTSDHIGKIIGADGKVYSHARCATAAGTTASAMIGYVGTGTGTYGSAGSPPYYSPDYNHGLAIALTDVQNTSGDEGYALMNSASASSAAPNYKRACPASCSRWFLASYGQWNEILIATATSNLRTIITTVGGSYIYSDAYWSSSPGLSDSSNTRCYSFFKNSWLEGNSTQTARVRAIFAF